MQNRNFRIILLLSGLCGLFFLIGCDPAKDAVKAATNDGQKSLVSNETKIPVVFTHFMNNGSSSPITLTIGDFKDAGIETISLLDKLASIFNFSGSTFTMNMPISVPVSVPFKFNIPIKATFPISIAINIPTAAFIWFAVAIVFYIIPYLLLVVAGFIWLVYYLKNKYRRT